VVWELQCAGEEGDNGFGEFDVVEYVRRHGIKALRGEFCPVARGGTVEPNAEESRRFISLRAEHGLRERGHGYCHPPIFTPVISTGPCSLG